MANELPTSIRLGIRLAGDRLKLLDRELTDIRSTFSNGSFNSDRHIRAVRDGALLAYREAAAKLIGAIISKKGTNAKNRRAELEAALDKLAGDVAGELNEAEVEQGFVGGTFGEELARAKARILVDFDEGYYHMAEADRRPGNIHIGSIGQMAGHIGTGNEGAVRATQTANEAAIFGQLSEAIAAGVADAAERARLLAAVERMVAARDNKSALAAAYGEFVIVAAAHMTIVAPFLPALTNLLGA